MDSLAPAKRNDGHGWVLTSFLAGQFHADHQTLPPDVQYNRMLRLEHTQAVEEVQTIFFGCLNEALLPNDVYYGGNSSRGGGIGLVTGQVCKTFSSDAVRNFVRCNEPRDRKSSSCAFGYHENIRLYPMMFNGKPFS